MATHYKIDKVLSANAKKGTMMVTVKFNGRTVTRHIKNGQGKHPDDNVPKMHDRANSSVNEVRGILRGLEETVRVGNVNILKMVDGSLKDVARVVLDDIVNRKNTTEEILKDAERRQTQLENENPIYVEYHD